jgi:Zinc finger, ZZ type
LPNDEDGAIHHGIKCEGCGILPIKGFLYRCSECKNFHLCHICEFLDHQHTVDHPFLKIKSLPKKDNDLKSAESAKVEKKGIQSLLPG